MATDRTTGLHQRCRIIKRCPPAIISRWQDNLCRQVGSGSCPIIVGQRISSAALMTGTAGAGISGEAEMLRMLAGLIGCTGSGRVHSIRRIAVARIATGGCQVQVRSRLVATLTRWVDAAAGLGVAADAVERTVYRFGRVL